MLELKKERGVQVEVEDFILAVKCRGFRSAKQ